MIAGLERPNLPFVENEEPPETMRTPPDFDRANTFDGYSAKPPLDGISPFSSSLTAFSDLISTQVFLSREP